MNVMEKSEFEIGTDETAVKLGLSPRSVRRLGEKGILEGKIEITSVGKQWFFKTESVESLVKAREAKLAKEERHRTAQDTLGHDRGRPQTTEVMTEAVRTPPMSDEKRVDFLERMLKEEREGHSETKEKLEQKEASLLEETRKASRLEGEKMGFEKYAQRLETQTQQLMGMLKETLKLKQPEAEDNFGHESSDDRRQRRTTEVVSTHVSDHAVDDKKQVNEIHVANVKDVSQHKSEVRGDVDDPPAIFQQYDGEATDQTRPNSAGEDFTPHGYPNPTLRENDTSQ